MRKFLLSATLFCSMILTAAAQDPAETRIRQLMQTQLECWNRGDIEGFMGTYWKSDSLLFIGKKGLTYGWQATLDNYKKAYPGKEGMGQLAFDLLEFKKLAGDAYFVVGKWKLTRTIGNLDGHFSIVLRRIGGEWKIVADHSS
ncbi:nuclear transport factor 2 family protein [Chitinophaga sp.]|uniref:YybH family protein n=1 Tax=Chitinophaga sp. TaxID=1869181 RepID=UPI00260B2347|nr:nuclear transport factor 2 family protein [uncultured Chitinophaga sp.]